MLSKTTFNEKWFLEFTKRGESTAPTLNNKPMKNFLQYMKDRGNAFFILFMVIGLGLGIFFSFEAYNKHGSWLLAFFMTFLAIVYHIMFYFDYKDWYKNDRF